MAHGAKPLDWQIAGAFRAQVLVLDDLGLERTHSPKAVATIGEIIRHRHESERRTITTTGFSHNELADIYGSGIARRLGDRGITIEWGKR
jgi:DNA replication protein DnaC